MLDLTPRQIQILRAVIEEFISSAEPVGSDTIDRRFNIGVSPATIRNEMVQLTKQGYLNKSHSSSGRVPTPQALKLYINELMKEKELSVADEVAAKEQVWKNRRQLNHLLRQIAVVMAERTNALGVSVVDDDELYHAGYANLLDMPEFEDVHVMRRVLEMIEEVKFLEQIFTYGTNENLIKVVYGQELGNKFLAPVGIIHTTFEVAGHRCRVAVIGSSRFDYPYVFPLMRYVRELVKDLVE